MTIDFHFSDVNNAFDDLVGLFRGVETTGIPTRIAREKSRNGDVLSYTCPTSFTYDQPWNRVLFNTERDCNPFFHLFEALWMLVGRNDLAPLVHFNSNMANYSDDGKTLNGAYGYRWRHSNLSGSNPYTKDRPPTNKTEGVDQLEVLIEHLTLHPDSRRAVLQMWNVEDDLLKIDNQFDQYSKDVCCNTSVYFRIVNEGGVDKLNMTVMNRSNDLIWGMLGANYVHFTFLQEYMAGRLGVVMGQYTHFTNNLHTYLDKFEGEKYLDYYNSPKYQEWLSFMEYQSKDRDLLSPLGINPFVSMFDEVETKEDQESFDTIMAEIVNSVTVYNPQQWLSTYVLHDLTVRFPFFGDLVVPVIAAFQCHKLRFYDAAEAHCRNIRHPHWRWACAEWINKRRDNWKNKTEAKEHNVTD